jgi:holin-like protein
VKGGVFVGYFKQFCVILGFSFLGELCHWLIPWPIPASIYGMVFLFLALTFKILPLEKVAATGRFLVSIMPVLFVAPTVSLLDCWSVVAPEIVKLVTIVVSSTFVVFLVSGWVTQLAMGKRGASDD